MYKPIKYTLQHPKLVGTGILLGSCYYGFLHQPWRWIQCNLLTTDVGHKFRSVRMRKMLNDRYRDS